MKYKNRPFLILGVELAIDELTFIVDDEGTIFISTDNLPQTLISQIRETLYQIAQRFYTTRLIF